MAPTLPSPFLLTCVPSLTKLCGISTNSLTFSDILPSFNSHFDCFFDAIFRELTLVVWKESCRRPSKWCGRGEIGRQRRWCGAPAYATRSTIHYSLITSNVPPEKHIPSQQADKANCWHCVYRVAWPSSDERNSLSGRRTAIPGCWASLASSIPSFLP